MLHERYVQLLHWKIAHNSVTICVLYRVIIDQIPLKSFFFLWVSVFHDWRHHFIYSKRLSLESCWEKSIWEKCWIEFWGFAGQNHDLIIRHAVVGESRLIFTTRRSLTLRNVILPFYSSFIHDMQLFLVSSLTVSPHVTASSYTSSSTCMFFKYRYKWTSLYAWGQYLVGLFLLCLVI